MDLHFRKKHAVHFEKIDTISSINPHFDWRILLLSFALICVAIVGLNVYLYFSMTKVEVLDGQVQKPLVMPAINKGELESVNEYYTRKLDTHVRLETALPTVVDPSE